MNMEKLSRNENLKSLLNYFLKRPYSRILVKLQDGLPVDFKEVKTRQNKKAI